MNKKYIIYCILVSDSIRLQSFRSWVWWIHLCWLFHRHLHRQPWTIQWRLWLLACLLDQHDLWILPRKDIHRRSWFYLKICCRIGPQFVADPYNGLFSVDPWVRAYMFCIYFKYSLSIKSNNAAQRCPSTTSSTLAMSKLSFCYRFKL